MAAQANGRAKKPKKATSTPNGALNGTAHINGNADKSQSLAIRSRKPRRTMTGAVTSIVARLVTWYLIITMAFRCPSSLTKLDGSSPRVCAPYLQARSYAAPYLDPYYQTYAAPYVEKAKPYADRFEKQVYTPAAKFTADKYATYGAHRVEQAKKYSNAQWDKSVRPQLQTVQDKVKGQYDLYLGPHVKTASDAAAPYYDQAKASLEEIYHLSVLPAYEASLPYMRKAHTHGHHVVVNYVFPYVRSVKDATFAFLVRTVWPQVRVLYGDNVEPQLVRISERLGRYRDQKKVESVVNSIESDFTTTTESTTEAPAMTVSEAAPVPTTKSGWGVFDDLFGADPSSSTASDGVETKPSATRPVKSQPTGEELKKMLNEDLRKWQTKFATAADKGSEDLEQRVAEITKRQVESGVKGHGRALVVKLEETADSTVASLKSFIKRTVESVPEDATDEDLEAAHAKCSAKTRELGLSVKERAQDVRAWKANYDQETDSLVKAAVKSTVVVLDKIHGLGLQEVGMRWAWLDGVTYQDWQNYHKLRTTLDEWQAEVEAVGSQHDGLRIAHEEAKKLEDEAMEASTRMVSELIRLKDVAKWKLWANDATDDFSNKPVPARVYKAAQQVSSQVSEAIQGSSTPISESVASAISSASSQASEAIQAAPSHASEAASSLSSGASEAIQGSSTPLSESAASSIESLSSQASEALLGSETPIAESVASSVSSAASAAYESPKKVFGGANAQILAEAKQVIFDEPLDDGDDDDDTVAKYSRKLQNVVADAGDRAEELSRAVSEALLGATKTQGTVESATSLASEQYERALAAASSVLYGTQQPVVESATSVASERFAQAVTAASYAMYGTPTPTAIIHTVQVQASSRYSDALRLASEQYENAKSQVSVLASGTPKPAHESLLSYFEKAYSDSVDVASERLSAALQYTDSVKSYAAGPTQGYFESVSSIASSRLSDGLSQASAQFSQPTGGASRQYYEAIGLAHARYSEFVGAASSAVYGSQQGTVESLASVASASAASLASGVSSSAQSIASQVSSGVVGTETPWSESVASQASINWESLIAKASDQVYGKPTPWAESVYSQAGAYGAQATVAAAQQYADVSALISELVIGKEPAFTESIMVRLSSAYYTGVPAAVQSVQSYAEDNFDAASSYAADAYSSASSVVSSIFTPPAAIETILSQASAQLDAAVDSASIAVYGTPKGAAEQASESVASAYSSIQSQISVKVYGTQQAQDSFTSAAASAQQAISQAIFGTPTAGDYVASATSGAGNVYSSIASVASENADYAYSAASEQASKVASAASSAIYGPEQGAMESASSRIALAVEAANSRISEIYAQASKGAEGVASTVSSAATQATQRVKDEL
ncbi:hypothetical protein HBH56_001930 [Parastagonospora nodorum]|uniref:Transcription factor hoxa13 n=1 Tax=Phaeosphaeria nodorum (strain SN15 / ATCC MYA-4574 / FGSC 10173) TaxID=321614 RepID=A0A7U2ENL3_PHANO|nr:hypothetical protein HBH56_001930 [Parastagonospora nodorum]QRC90161.1 hypothetical protein JI435_095670 [Parastagonospora nodorum SN15]KAH3937597.1 hypothetical protein HBH54_001940 [Parastagonospora nodorum]KAH4145676.1 hypothetical protein HBH45_010580 [Parastagonospora nodorum]KAH4164347.1 hypothetical protein HBH44_073910 [Parastagonospora nodorum]